MIPLFFATLLLTTTPSLHTLDSLSISQHLAFYELYSETPEGKQALSHAWDLLNVSKKKIIAQELPLPPLDIQGIISLITRQHTHARINLSEDALSAIENLASSLVNRQLPGSQIWTKKELDLLPSEQIDLSRGLLINQFNENKEEIRQYEASIDLIALQILARLPPAATPEQKIQEINRFIFQEMRFRFPPHSLYAKEVDLYTFLPSVLDGREGVCLGISILYLCIAQRIDLPLEIITPPGHIFLRYRNGIKVINIETTARGINLPSDTYLGIDTRRLQLRNLKEVIGMAYMNQAGVAWGQKNYPFTVELYEKARTYVPDDPLLQLLLGMNYLFVGKIKEGKKLLTPLKNYTFEYAISKETLAEDYLSKKIDTKGLQAVFERVDETRESILSKQKQLLSILKKYPQFRAGLFHLAISFLQLGKTKEALEVLQKYHLLDPTNSTVEYYLSLLSLERIDYNKAWAHLKQTEKLLQEREHKCKALRSLRYQLKSICPES